MKEVYYNFVFQVSDCSLKYFKWDDFDLHFQIVMNEWTRQTLSLSDMLKTTPL